MTIKTDSYIVGSNADDTRNFLLDTDLAGALRIRRKSDGSGGTVLTVDSAGVVSLPNNPAVFTKRFVSADIAYTNSSATTIAHGLGAKPSLVQVTLKCLTAELGYVAGDEVQITASFIAGVGAVTIEFDATNIVIVNAAIAILNKSTFANGQVTPANWRLVARAWV
jgi:hypothetical protein